MTDLPQFSCGIFDLSLRQSAETWRTFINEAPFGRAFKERTNAIHYRLVLKPLDSRRRQKRRPRFTRVLPTSGNSTFSNLLKHLPKQGATAYTRKTKKRSKGRKRDDENEREKRLKRGGQYRAGKEKGKMGCVILPLNSRSRLP
jgi:hypothetical protein